jgi:ABC-type Fe3+ transport system permease subunit
MTIPMLIIGAILIGGIIVWLVFWKRRHERAQEPGKTSALSEEHHKSGLKTSDVILLVAIVAFLVFLAVAVFIILTDTRGLRIPPNPSNWVEPEFVS